MEKKNDYFEIEKTKIGLDFPPYFIADIGSNHEGDIKRAKELIHLSQECGANAVKFQHFLARELISDKGFKKLGGNIGHQAKWEKDVFAIYEENEYQREWDKELMEEAKKAKITWLTTPYDFSAVELVKDQVSAYKIGSGDITWLSMLELIARKGKPVLLGTGASSMKDVKRAVDYLLKYNQNICIMQCNTNYSENQQNIHYVNLNVIRSYAKEYPDIILGLSDHTKGIGSVIGAIVFGARVIEKHFTDDRNRKGPDHSFAMDPKSWKEMVREGLDVFHALGDGVKKVEENEKETHIVQRRSYYVKENMRCGERIQKEKIEVLRPYLEGSLEAYDDPIGKVLLKDMQAGDVILKTNIE